MPAELGTVPRVPRATWSTTWPRHLAQLAALPAEVLAATDLYSDGDWAGAEAIVRPFLLRHP